MNWNPTPPVVGTAVHTAMPQTLRRHEVTEWSRANKGGAVVDSFIEGPCFDRESNLYIVDIPHGRIMRISPALEWSVVAEYDGEPNGLAWHPDGRVLIADYKNGILALDPASGAITPVIARRNSERFKGPNDLIVASNGDLYFTDQGQTGLHDPTGRVYRLRPDGRLDCLISNGPSPNGLVLSPDEKVLFVAMTRDNSVWRLPLLADGSTSKVGRFAQFYGVSGPDGLTMDRDGNLFVAHASLGAVFVLNPHGEGIARIESCAGRTITNVTFGGAHHSTLFITDSSSGSVLTTQWNTPGLGG
ncbi:MULTISPECIES: SMP-30/gluconolactonase/LRE family protein [Paraburkholderia]|jgi:gluconolactonase|uniref:Gluconolactonase n=1 Tax=Paraburkholderia phenazinium TaxID=60549 RepID=A0A1N6HTE2_9BURK|nr:SMP-30/gluconolactonase/LRE family protein [Paraburkholderia phenazinium]SIO22925.1 gluconolactonase [Paraburkholderia phenazinium]